MIYCRDKQARRWETCVNIEIFVWLIKIAQGPRDLCVSAERTRAKRVNGHWYLSLLDSGILTRGTCRYRTRYAEEQLVPRLSLTLIRFSFSVSGSWGLEKKNGLLIGRESRATFANGRVCRGEAGSTRNVTCHWQIRIDVCLVDSAISKAHDWEYNSRWTVYSTRRYFFFFTFLRSPLLPGGILFHARVHVRAALWQDNDPFQSEIKMSIRAIN